jgi:hypothetical protein
VLLGATPFVLGQTSEQPGPAPSANILGVTLVAWSQMQKPNPVPQPLPPPDRPDQQPETPDAQTPTQPPPPATSQDTEWHSSQKFTGTIVKDSGKFVLKVAKDLAYQLDDQEKASEFEGKEVRIMGHLDKGSNMLHVTHIELLS